MKLRSLAVAAVALTTLAPGAPSAAVEPGEAVRAGTPVIAAPGGFISPGTYATPVAILQRGGDLIFYNGDIAPHDVTSVSKKRGKPIFRSKLISTGQSAPVAGVSKLKPGSYLFYCTRHHWMQGRLIVQ